MAWPGSGVGLLDRVALARGGPRVAWPGSGEAPTRLVASLWFGVPHAGSWRAPRNFRSSHTMGS
jgi:hypothetical protein